MDRRTQVEKILHTFISNRPVYIVGFSVEGESTARFLLKHAVSITICDQKSPRELGQTYDEFKKLGATFHTGKNYLKDIKPESIVFRTPGMPLWLPELVRAKKMNCSITSHTKLFFDLCPCPIIGVTGTKGKGTTSTLIYEILKTSGKDTYLGGNIGQPPLTFIDRLQPSSLTVLELSSFQLQDMTKSPHVAVILMTTQEHLASGSVENPNYHRTIHEYIQSKSTIVRYQEKSDDAIINADYPNSFVMRKFGKGKKYFFSKKERGEGASLDSQTIWLTFGGKHIKIGDVSKTLLPGLHNRENMMAASLASYLLGAEPSVIHHILVTFPGLEHRLELVLESNGVKYYNDSFSTTPETAIAAIKAFHQPIILIAGGSEKGSDFRELGQNIANSSVKCVFLIGQMTEKIHRAIPKITRDCQIFSLGRPSMVSIVKNAQHVAHNGDIILLSPGCASFDMFKNYKERGSLFKDAVYAQT